MSTLARPPPGQLTSVQRGRTKTAGEQSHPKSSKRDQENPVKLVAANSMYPSYDNYQRRGKESL